MDTLNTLDDWLAYCERLHPATIDLGLERVRSVAQAMGLAFDCPVITVAGTNGKGSSCAMLEAILGQAGYRTGVYTSPHLVHFEERCRVRGEMVQGAALLPHFERVQAARGDTSLTYFEFTMLAIFSLLAEAKLDVVILEVGVGGRLDSVNIIDADCALITSIDIDHTELLGKDREAIGFERPASCAPANQWWSATRCHRKACWTMRPKWVLTCGAWAVISIFPVTSCNGPGLAAAVDMPAWPTRRCAAPTSWSTPRACWRR
jgi:folylpolyglutamate synthase/dihydropteroate synthase